MAARVSFVLSALATSCYTLRETYFQGKTLLNTRSTSSYLNDSSTPQEHRAHLAWVEAVRAFASREGLDPGGSYTSVVASDRKVVSYLVSASQAFRLEPITWSFPFVGRVGYLGFYFREHRDDEARSLESMGYDVYKAEAAAFSLLGWMPDPIFPAFLEYEKEELAHLILHELVHRNYWRPDDTAFNENLAEYIAESLTPKFLAEQNVGAQEYLAKREERQVYFAWLIRLKNALPAVLEKHHLPAKEALYRRFTHDEWPPSLKRLAHLRDGVWNNSRVLQSLTYEPNRAYMICLARRAGTANVGSFLRWLEARANDLGCGDAFPR